VSRKGDGSDAVNHGDGVPGLTSSVNLNTTSTPNTTSTSTLAAIEEHRAISAEYFEYVCPPSRRVEIWYGRGAYRHLLYYSLIHRLNQTPAKFHRCAA
jgi:hypothetical protein